MSQAKLTGKSTPKVVRVNASDEFATFFKNLGNGRRVPTFWAETVTMASGTTEVVVASGVSFNNFAAAGGKWQLSPLSAAAVTLAAYVDKNTTGNVVKVISTAGAAVNDTDFDVYVFLGEDAHYNEYHSNQVWQRLDQASLRGKKV